MDRVLAFPDDLKGVEVTIQPGCDYAGLVRRAHKVKGLFVAETSSWWSDDYADLWWYIEAPTIWGQKLYPPGHPAAGNEVQGRDPRGRAVRFLPPRESLMFLSLAKTQLEEPLGWPGDAIIEASYSKNMTRYGEPWALNSFVDVAALLRQQAGYGEDSWRPPVLP